MLRREFLKTMTTIIGGTAVMGAGLSACRGVDEPGRGGSTAESSAAADLRLGLYLPSARAESATERFAGGLSAALGDGQAPLHPQPASPQLIIGDFDGRRRLRARPLREFVDQHDLDLVVVLANAADSEALVEVVDRTRVPLIVATAGPELPSPAVAEEPLIFVASMDAWRAHWASGAYCARHLGRRGALVTSVHDAGYDAVFAFEQGFQANGGAQLGIEFVDAPALPTTADELAARLVQTRSEFVYALSTSADSRPMWDRLGPRARRMGLPVVAGPFLGNSPEDARIDGADALVAHRGWSAILPTQANRVLAGVFDEMNLGAPDAFAALGYDTGAWVLAGANAVGEHAARRPTGHEAIAAALRSASFKGTRGRYRVDPGTGFARAPMHRETLRVRGDGRLDSFRADPVELPDGLDGLLHKRRIGQRCGETRAYLPG
ncbi:MAG: ABC transporter substrate-binding protein [Persicimonas sp.]